MAGGGIGTAEPVAAARYHCHLDSTDLAAVAARDDEAALLGADFSRSVGQAELHGARREYRDQVNAEDS